jgi:competence protein ComEA
MIRGLVIAAVLTAIFGTAGVPARAGAQAGAPAQAQTARPPAPTQPEAASVNLNTATQAQLEKLPGVGAAVALRIIEYRQRSGGFKKVEDLMNVRGIGEKTFLKLKPLLTVTPPKAAAR